jgi:hypothetical protein
VFGGEGRNAGDHQIERATLVMAAQLLCLEVPGVDQSDAELARTSLCPEGATRAWLDDDVERRDDVGPEEIAQRVDVLGLHLDVSGEDVVIPAHPLDGGLRAVGGARRGLCREATGVDGFSDPAEQPVALLLDLDGEGQVIGGEHSLSNLATGRQIHRLDESRIWRSRSARASS